MDEKFHANVSFSLIEKYFFNKTTDLIPIRSIFQQINLFIY